MFNLKRPCTTCPFTKGQGELFKLHPERIKEITTSTAFQCHKTVDYSIEDSENNHGDSPEQCAGLMAILHKEKQYNVIMRLAIAMDHLDPELLDPEGITYASIKETLEAHAEKKTN